MQLPVEKVDDAIFAKVSTCKALLLIIINKFRHFCYYVTCFLHANSIVPAARTKNNFAKRKTGEFL